MLFYLGTHEPSWLATAGVPLFVSRRRLAPLRRLPRAIATWALDSGGFTELSMRGAWAVRPRQYIDEVRRFRDEIGSLAWAAPQDWMCEPAVLAKTGLSVAEHQRRTVENLIDLRMLAPDLPFVPVLQGWTEGDYLDHVDAYALAGVELTDEPLVGLGTVCRRQSTIRAGLIASGLAADGINLHGFGFKRTGLRGSAGAALVSADSLAWSLHARKSKPLPECVHASCANCERFAKEWRAELLTQLETPS